MIAVSLNVSGGIRLIKLANCACAPKTLQTQRGRTHSAGCVRQWFCTAELFGERRYENWNTQTNTHSLRDYQFTNKSLNDAYRIKDDCGGSRPRVFEEALCCEDI